MPNWCSNHLKVTGPEHIVAEFVSATSTPAGSLQFARLHPMPEGPTATPGDPMLSAMPDWYQWNVANWGTKWDVSGDDDDEVRVPVLAREDGCVTWEFNTAWAPPLAWLAHVSPLFPALTFALGFDEPGNNFSGMTVLADGILDEGASWEGDCSSWALCRVPSCDESVFLGMPWDSDFDPDARDDAFCDEHELEAAVHAVAVQDAKAAQGA